MEHLKKIEVHDVDKLGQILEELRGTELIDIQQLNQALSDLKELEKHDVNSLRKKMDDIRNFRTDELEKVNHVLAALKGTETKDIKKIAEVTEHLSKLEGHHVKKLTELADELKDTEVHDVKKLREAVAEFRKAENHDVKRLTDEISSIKESIDNEAVNRVSVEKRLSSMENEFGKFENVEAAAIEALNKMELRDVQNALDQMKEMKFSIDEESTKRISMEKRLLEMEEEIHKNSQLGEEMENVEGIGLNSLSARVQDMEKNMKMISMKMLTQQLNEFAKAMDRRFPNIVSREEYKREIADLRQRVRTVEAPDMAPLGSRVERLERKVEEAIGMMKGMYNRIPYVVE